MLDAAARRLIDPPLGVAAHRLCRLGIAADTVTLAGFAVGLAAIVAIGLGWYLVGLAALLINRLADGLDGAVARCSVVTDRGGFLDIVLDFIVYSGLVFGFAVADPAQNALPAAFLIFAFMGTGSSFLAFAIMAAKRGLESSLRGTKSLYYLGGLTEGTETILLFVVACAAPRLFPWLAWLFGTLCWVTTAARLATGWRVFRGERR